MLAPTEGGEGLNFAKQKIWERLTTPQSRCSRASSAEPAPLLSASQTFSPLTGKFTPDKGSQGCGGGGRFVNRPYGF